MNIHEYQAKEILKKYGLNIPQGFVATTVQEVENADKILPNSSVYVVKAQIHAGGRGKGGGVKLAKNQQELTQFSQEILGMQLVTKQTGSEGKKVHKIYIEEGSNIDQELYLSLVLDRALASVAIIASREGGMEIEEVASSSPEKIIKVNVDTAIGLQSFHIRKVFFGLSLNKELYKDFAATLSGLYKVFVEKEASQIEINPLIVTKEKKIVVLDAKFNFDDSALFRHKDIESLFDPNEEDPSEVRAAKHGLSYVKMHGTIGCMVNGAGLAMATMDIIDLYGGTPANFLDVGGTADEERVLQALKIITEDNNVKGILINIFGGIVRCDIIARGLVNAAKVAKIELPIVVRLAGTNSEEAMKIIKKSELSIYPSKNVDEAARKIVELTA